MTARTIGSLVTMIAAALVAAPAFAAAGSDGRNQQSRCTLTLENGGSLSASIANAPLKEVLAQLARETGATIIWMAPAKAVRTTTSFRSLPLREAMARLLARQDYLLVFRDGIASSRLDRVLIAPRGDVDTISADDSAIAAVGLDAAPPTPLAEGSAPPRARLEAVYDLIEQTGSLAEDSPVRDVLLGVLADGDDAEVERASSIGLATLADETLEFTARTDDALRPLAIRVLAQRAANEPLALAALNRLAGDGDDLLAGEGLTPQ